MNNTRVLQLTPVDTTNQIPEPVNESNIQNSAPKSRGNSIRAYAADRQRKLLVIALKLAEQGGYDSYLRIKDKDGKSVEQSDLIGLLLHSLSPGRSVKGLREFVDLLHRSGVTPDLIINTQVKEMLESYGTRPSKNSHNMEVQTDTRSNDERPMRDQGAGTDEIEMKDADQQTDDTRRRSQRKKKDPLPDVDNFHQKKVKEVIAARKHVPSGSKRVMDDDEESVLSSKRHKSTIWDDNDSDLDE